MAEGFRGNTPQVRKPAIRLEGVTASDQALEKKADTIKF